MLAYKALNADAEENAQEVASVVTARPKAANTIPYTVVIVTDKDLSGFLEWRSDIGQMQVLVSITESLLKNPTLLNPPPPSGPIKPPAVIGSIGDVQTAVGIVKDLASAFAINETVVGVPGTIKDIPLMNVVGRKLKARSIRVLVPSLYIPDLLGGSGIDQTILFQNLTRLDEERRKIVVKLDSMPMI